MTHMPGSVRTPSQVTSGPGLLANGLFAALSREGYEHCRFPLSSG